MSDYIVYLLVNPINNSTYLGITNNSARRLRQHNGELVGGAKYTRMKCPSGQWRYYLKIKHLTKSEALSIERSAKNLRRRARGKTALDRRLYVLLPLLCRGRYPDCKLEFFILDEDLDTEI